MTRVILGMRWSSPPPAAPVWPVWPVTGLPLSEAGLDQLVVVAPDGDRAAIEGLVVYPGETLEVALTRSFPGCQIVFSPAEAELLRKGLP